MSAEHIKTFAVLDLETNDFPKEHSCSITELSIYAFSENCLQDEDDDIELADINAGIEGVEKFKNQSPELPRVLHKLTLMINPIKLICPKAAEMSGLGNDMLSREAPFDKNTADCLLLFLERLEKPVCLVAHNGWSFDFPVVRHVLETINMTLPSSIFCIDSFKAFREFDEKQLQIEKASKVWPVIIDLEKEEYDKYLHKVENDENIHLPKTNALKRKMYENNFEDTHTVVHSLEKKASSNCQNTNDSYITKCDTINVAASTSVSSLSHNDLSPTHKRLASLTRRRSVFSDNFSPKTKYPKKGSYVLGNIYERVFKAPAENLHRAESDVAILTKLILHYGLNFLAYAEERKQLFENVPKL